jgi:sialic acid synthase SpsE
MTAGNRKHNQPFIIAELGTARGGSIAKAKEMLAKVKLSRGRQIF